MTEKTKFRQDTEDYVRRTARILGDVHDEATIQTVVRKVMMAMMPLVDEPSPATPEDSDGNAA